MLDSYLKSLNEEQENESVGGFAIDSFPTKASKRPLPVIYPESTNLDEFDLNKKRIMIDFDGTIHKYSKGWDDGSIYDDAFSGARDIINRLRNDGYEIVIFTTRVSEISNGIEQANEQKEMVKDALEKYGIKIDLITSEKLPAEIYIDDRAIRFSGIWDNNFYNEIKKRVTKVE